MFAACHADVKDDYITTLANCSNLADSVTSRPVGKRPNRRAMKRRATAGIN
jgi:hypothetical protein